MEVAYPRVAARLFGHAHAIEPGAMRAILEGPLARRILSAERPKRGPKNTHARRMERLSARVNAEPVSVNDDLGEYYLTAGGIAIVPVYGILSRRFDWLTALCGWTTYEGLIATYEAVLADGRVRGVLMDGESPGGEAGGMIDAAEVIIAARSVKPVWAVANDFAASAAYAIVGSAERLLLPRLAKVGSIGAMMVHVDQSQADAQAGLKYTAIASGDHKMDGWEHAQLSPDALAALRAQVDHCRAEFAALVARQGRMSAKQALATEAAMFSDAAAVDARLADGIATFEDALNQLTELVASRPQNSIAAAATAVQEEGADPMTTTSTEAGKEPANAPAAVTTASSPAAVTAASEGPAPGEAKPSDVKESGGADKPAQPDVDEKKPPEPIAAYTAAMMSETLELCTIAGIPLADARAFITAQTPIAKVRADLMARQAKSADEVELMATPARGSSATAGWDEAIAKVNALNGHAKKA